MRIVAGLGQFDHNPALDEDERLRYCVEMGVQGVRLGGPKLPGAARWEYEDLLALRQRIERFGLRLEVIENVPMRFLDRAVLGLPGTEEQLEHYRATIRNMGRAGIPILGYHWMPQQVWRTRPFALARGSAEVAVFDLETARLPLDGARHVFGGGAYTTRMVAERQGQLLTHGRVYTEAEMWATWEHFIRAVLPAAAEAGVQLSHHADDPPVESLGGIARPFRSFEAFKRAEAFTNSPAWGLTFCVGTWSSMPTGRDGVMQGLEYFGSRGKICYVHFRDVKGSVPRFLEAFLGEGNCDPVEILRVLKRVGYQGFLIEDHVPILQGDNAWEARSRGYALGYLEGLLRAVEHPSDTQPA